MDVLFRFFFWTTFLTQIELVSALSYQHGVEPWYRYRYLTRISIHPEYKFNIPERMLRARDSARPAEWKRTQRVDILQTLRTNLPPHTFFLFADSRKEDKVSSAAN